MSVPKQKIFIPLLIFLIIPQTSLAFSGSDFVATIYCATFGAWFHDSSCNNGSVELIANPHKSSQPPIVVPTTSSIIPVSIPTQVINHYITQPVVTERIVSAPVDTADFVTRNYVQAQSSSLSDSVGKSLNSVTTNDISFTKAINVGTTLTVTGAATLSSTLAVTGQLTTPYFAASSGTATSTVSSGGFSVGSNKLVVQQSSGNVGIGTTTPRDRFDLGNNRLGLAGYSYPLRFGGGNSYALEDGLSIDQGVQNHLGALVYNPTQISGDANFGIEMESQYTNLNPTLDTDTELYYFWNGPTGVARRLYQANTSWGGAYSTIGRAEGFARWGFNVNQFSIDNGSLYSGNFLIDYTTTPGSLTWTGSTALTGTLAVSATTTLSGALNLDKSLNLTSNRSYSATYFMNGGTGINAPSVTYTDTSSSGSVGAGFIHYFGAPTIAATNSTTYSQMSTLYIDGPPVAGSHVSITTPISFLVGAGTARFDGNIYAGALITGGGSTGIKVDSSGNVGIGSTSPMSLFSIKGGNVAFAGDNFSMRLYDSNANSRGIIIRPTSNNFNSHGFSIYDQNADAERFSMNSSGSIGISSTSPASRLAITQSVNTISGGLWLAGTDGDFRSIYMSDTSGNLTFNGGDTSGSLNAATLNSAGAWTNASDRSYKENIVDLDTKYGLNDIMKINPRFYTMKGSSKPQIGFIAQELKPIIPEVVEGVEGSMGISYGNLVALLVQGIKELNNKKDSILAWFSGGKFKVQNDICVDDICVTKDQFKALLIEVGGTKVATISTPVATSAPIPASTSTPVQQPLTPIVDTSRTQVSVETTPVIQGTAITHNESTTTESEIATSTPSIIQDATTTEAEVSTTTSVSTSSEETATVPQPSSTPIIESSSISSTSTPEEVPNTAAVAVVWTQFTELAKFIYSTLSQFFQMF